MTRDTLEIYIDESAVARAEVLSIYNSVTVVTVTVVLAMLEILPSRAREPDPIIGTDYTN